MEALHLVKTFHKVRKTAVTNSRAVIKLENLLHENKKYVRHGFTQVRQGEGKNTEEFVDSLMLMSQFSIFKVLTTIY